MDTKQVQKIIKPMIQQIRTSAFVPEYQDAASDEECLGLAISKFTNGTATRYINRLSKR